MIASRATEMLPTTRLVTLEKMSLLRETSLSALEQMSCITDGPSSFSVRPNLLTISAGAVAAAVGRTVGPLAIMSKGSPMTSDRMRVRT